MTEQSKEREFSLLILLTDIHRLPQPIWCAECVSMLVNGGLKLLYRKDGGKQLSYMVNSTQELALALRAIEQESDDIQWEGIGHWSGEYKFVPTAIVNGTPLCEYHVTNHLPPRGGRR